MLRNAVLGHLIYPEPTDAERLKAPMLHQWQFDLSSQGALQVRGEAHRDSGTAPFRGSLVFVDPETRWAYTVFGWVELGQAGGPILGDKLLGTLDVVPLREEMILRYAEQWCEALRSDLGHAV